MPPYPGSKNHHGEVELIDDVPFTHWFVEVLRSRYHFVSAGEPDQAVIVFLHGLPESWFAFAKQMRALCDQYYCVAVDLKGYGQSEKDPAQEYSFAHCAMEVALLIEKLGIDAFYLVTHDRGSILGDHLCHQVNGFNRRIRGYFRMQQSFLRPHSEPRPPQHLFASHLGTIVFAMPELVCGIYRQREQTNDDPAPIIKLFAFLKAMKVPRAWQKALFRRLSRLMIAKPGRGIKFVHQPIPDALIQRFIEEFSYPGIEYAVPLTFKLTNFDIELEERRSFLFAKMTMPVRLCQGEFDPGQPPFAYADLEAEAAQYKLDVSIVWIEGVGHYQHPEAAEAVTAEIRKFFAGRANE